MSLSPALQRAAAPDPARQPPPPDPKAVPAVDAKRIATELRDILKMLPPR